MLDREQLKDAQALAQFANLKPQEFEYFQHNYPNFFPPAFWTSRSGVMFKHKLSDLQSPPQNEAIQIMWARILHPVIQEMWRAKFPSETVISLIGLGSWSVFGTASPEHMEALKSMGFELRAYPYQRALMLLHTHPKLAAFCPKCGSRFVKAKPRQTFCTDQCFNTNRVAYKKERWKQKGKTYRRNANKRKIGGR